MQVRLGRSILVACAVLALAGAVHAGAINVFNTGVTAGGVSAADGSVDLHYVLTVVPGGTTVTRDRTTVGGYPITGPPWGWIGDNAISTWVGPNNDAQLTGLAGDFTYRTTFDLTGMNPSTAALSGIWAADDYGVNILLNGVTTSNPNPWWNAWLPFTINSGFVAGVNTLDFVVHNTDGSTGLRVEMSGTANAANAVPEPASLVLLVAGLAALMGLRRRLV